MKLLPLFIALVVASGCAPSDRPTADGEQSLKASVTANNIFLNVKNDDTQDWINVRVQVNGRYQCHTIDRMAPLHTEELGLAGCIADDGMRFNPATMAPVKVIVTAVGVDNSRIASGVFTFSR